jgi:hypothetical protein
MAKDLTVNNLVVEGNVGIGTTSPTAKLQVQGSEAEGSQEFERLVLFQVSDGSVGQIYREHNGTDNYIGIECFNVGNSKKTPIVLQQWGGNVGIGIRKPDHRLQVKGDALITGGCLYVNSENAGRLTVGAAGGMPGLYSGADGAKDLTLGVPEGRRVYLGYLDNSNQDAYVEGGTGNAYFKGNVGIGRASPSAKLDVGGTIKATGLGVDGTIKATGLGVDGTIKTTGLGVDGTIKTTGLEVGGTISATGLDVGGTISATGLDVGGTIKATGLDVGGTIKATGLVLPRNPNSDKPPPTEPLPVKGQVYWDESGIWIYTGQWERAPIG